MATAEQLIQQVWFALETLRERNGHHEFEMICLGVARRRIASNLLPATGPVSSGGDQGRDAESHWTNLPNEIGTSSASARLATTENVVLDCTTQCDNVPSKIRHDLQSICGSGQSVARVVYFTVTPVEISKRHELQEGAPRNHRVTLDIWPSRTCSTWQCSTCMCRPSWLHPLPRRKGRFRPGMSRTVPDGVSAPILPARSASWWICGGRCGMRHFKPRIRIARWCCCWRTLSEAV